MDLSDILETKYVVSVQNQNQRSTREVLIGQITNK